MIKCKEDYIGRKFNHLTIIEQADDYVSANGRPKSQFLCKCDCKTDNPNLIIGRLDCLKNGHTSSCGCVKREETIKRNAIIEHPLYKELTLVLNLSDDAHAPYGKFNINSHEIFFSMDDYETLKNYHWYLCVGQSNYISAFTSINGKPVSLHKLLGFANADHINRNPLDNRRENLDKFVTKSIQCQNRGVQYNNSSGCKGVRYQFGKWSARITVNRREIYLGRFDNKDDAIIARLYGEIKYFDKRAWQKELMERYDINYELNSKQHY